MKKISILITLLAISSSAEARWFWQNNDAENMSDNNCKNECHKTINPNQMGEKYDD